MNGVWWPPSSSKRVGRVSPVRWVRFLPPPPISPAAGDEGSDGEEVAGAGVGRRVTQLAHRPGLDLADALPGEVEVLADLFERARLAAVETEAQREDLALTLVERGEQLLDLVGQQRGGRRPRTATRPSGPRRCRRARRRRLRASGSESDSGSAAKRSASVTLSSGISTSADSSASVAGRPSLSSRRERAFWRRARVSPAWTGRRMVRPVLAMPRVIAWRIHHVA